MQKTVLTITVVVLALAIVSAVSASDDKPPAAVIEVNGTPYILLPMSVEPTATPTPTATPMPTDLALPALQSAGSWAEAQTILDASIEYWYPKILERQSLLLEAGGYVQMLPSHSFIPANGAHYYPDQWQERPTDQSADWRKARLVPYSPMPYRLTIDIYVAPSAPGFVACWDVVWDGDLMQRCINHGPEILRDSAGWEVMP